MPGDKPLKHLLVPLSILFCKLRHNRPILQQGFNLSRDIPKAKVRNIWVVRACIRRHLAPRLSVQSRLWLAHGRGWAGHYRGLLAFERRSVRSPRVKNFANNFHSLNKWAGFGPGKQRWVRIKNRNRNEHKDDSYIREIRERV